MSTPILPASPTLHRYLALVLAMLLAASMLTIAAAAPARADPASNILNGVTYTVDTDGAGAGATATDYNAGFGSVVVIPDTVSIGGTDYTVTGIGLSAFENKQLTSITLPDGLTTIGFHAFSENHLTSVTLPDGLTTIGDGAFFANGMTSVTLPDSLTTIGGHAFYYNQLPTLTLSDSLTTIGEYAFNDNQLTSVTLPERLATLGDGAFGSNQLTSVAFPDSLTTIGDYAFTRNQLTSVVIPPRVTAIGASAFRDNADMTRVRFTGPAPATIDGTDSEDPSLGTASGLTVTFPVRFLAQSAESGYTTPEWLGYSAYAGGHAVSFDTGGGTLIDPVTAWEDELLTLPPSPTREGYTFTGWHTTPELETLFNSELPVTEDLTLYAGWQPDSIPTEPVTPGWSSSVSGSLGSLALSTPGA